MLAGRRAGGRLPGESGGLFPGEGNEVTAHVGTQGFGNDDTAVFLLVVLQDGGDRAAYGQAGSIQGVDEFRLRLGVAAEADVRAPCLEVEEVGARGNFAVPVGFGQPDLDVVSRGAGEADISRTQADDMVGQAQDLQGLLGVVRQAVQLFPGLLRFCEFDQLDLVELVLADEAARILAGAAASARKQAV